ncbi:sensor histidine kinase [Calidifontibacillus oryziterrae]|uniref:sensor histidine kinase n=1 Tax=Calidifontibacillus oryziterrae TaxID=1191699 RepID=UPI0002DA9F40|nr:ATP-binding protein [Calidifontibacillus oryziterrae]
MKKISMSLWQKLWLTVTIAVVLGILATYGMTHYFYKKLYVDHVEVSLKQEGMRLASEYTGGEITPQLKERFEWYNQISQAEILFVNNPKELSACLPFEVDYESLIGVVEREQLINGEIITKTGYEKRFDRQIMGVIVPLLEEKRLKGILYIYLPLASINDLFREAGVFIAIISLLFTLAAIVLGRKIARKLTTPLNEMERVAYQMSKGDYSEKVQVRSNDEIGRLGIAFNQMSEAVKEEDERRKEFLGNVSHELRTPISYIKGYSEAILDGTVTNGEDSKKYLHLIHREAGRMQRLVRDLLDLAQMDGKSIPMDKQPLALAQLIEEALEKFDPFLHEKNLRLFKELDHDVIIMGDQDRIEQIIQNLMENAIRYSPTNDVIEVTLVTIKGNGCKIVIKDNGIGIPKEHLHRIGERFFRIDKARTRQYGGTGLGMAIVQKIVQLHEGDIMIESEEGKGTKISIFLPTI